MSDDIKAPNEKLNKPVDSENELSVTELDNVSGGVPGWWDYDDPTTHM